MLRCALGALHATGIQNSKMAMIGSAGAPANPSLMRSTLQEGPIQLL